MIFYISKALKNSQLIDPHYFLFEIYALAWRVESLIKVNFNGFIPNGVLIGLQGPPHSTHLVGLQLATSLNVVLTSVFLSNNLAFDLPILKI